MPQADAGPAQQRDTARDGDLVRRVTAVAGGPADPGRDQQTALVVQAQRLDRQPSSRGELGGPQFLHDAIIKRAPGARSRGPPVQAGPESRKSATELVLATGPGYEPDWLVGSPAEAAGSVQPAGGRVITSPLLPPGRPAQIPAGVLQLLARLPDVPADPVGHAVPLQTAVAGGPAQLHLRPATGDPGFVLHLGQEAHRR
jgi:hypothetical protein